jgi:hypothetical protein
MISADQFFAWNPAVSKDCGTNFWLGYAYCVGVSSATTTTPTVTSTPTATPTPPADTHPGQPANCNKWHVVKDGDTCPSVEALYMISADQFFAWNPAVSKDCGTNFWLGYAYCVGISGMTPTTPTTTPTTTTQPSNMPSPTQDGNAVSNCNAYGQAQDGDWCAAFAERNSVRDVDLYAWNTVLGPNGENCGSSFWSGYWYCIGIEASNRLRLPK